MNPAVANSREISASNSDLSAKRSSKENGSAVIPSGRSVAAISAAASLVAAMNASYSSPADDDTPTEKVSIRPDGDVTLS